MGQPKVCGVERQELSALIRCQLIGGGARRKEDCGNLRRRPGLRGGQGAAHVREVGVQEEVEVGKELADAACGFGVGAEVTQGVGGGVRPSAALSLADQRGGDGVLVAALLTVPAELVNQGLVEQADEAPVCLGAGLQEVVGDPGGPQGVEVSLGSGVAETTGDGQPGAVVHAGALGVGQRR